MDRQRQDFQRGQFNRRAQPLIEAGVCCGRLDMAADAQATRLCAQALDAWVADFTGHRPGGGESVQAFMQRVAAVWDELGDVVRDDVLNETPPTDTLWITHAGVIRAATLLHRGLRQITRADQWPTATPGFGQWTALA
ncbi:histidine phosphatase family protein [Polaromonas sp. P1(28)-13]|nr:histidine phosphatase family protein [Polaromonas sp. P1-6]UUZ78388.1 histidine phosphatase family protein [Polaromonas sp. P1(28)-13]